jgi:hypothetical protein
MISVEFENLILDEMMKAGITPPQEGIKYINKMVRFNPETGSKTGKLKARYIVELSHKDTGKYICQFEDYSSPVGIVTVFESKLKSNARPLTPQEIRKREIAQKKAEQREAWLKKIAREKLKAMAQASFRVDSHPYLFQKKFTKSEQSCLDIISDKHNRLLVPIRDVKTNKIINCQSIFEEPTPYFSLRKSPLKREKQKPFPEGTVFKRKFLKRFVKNLPKKGGFYMIAEKESDGKIYKGLDRDGLVCIAEGLATGFEAHLLLGSTVIVCFDADNMKNVAKELIHTYDMKPENLLTIADNDRFVEMTRPELGNKGLKVAKEIQAIFGIDYIYPHVNTNDFSILKQISDFNDLRIHYGAEYTRDMISEQIDRIIEKRHATKEDLIEGFNQIENDTPQAYYFYMNQFAQR